ncbi:protein YgfX [Natronocella acetinitrilica]|uniref:protein YgfX n=1 Tax=Natronocella acetinitrilica TaxID=414046 RepID=UPI00344B277D
MTDSMTGSIRASAPTTPPSPPLWSASEAAFSLRIKPSFHGVLLRLAGAACIAFAAGAAATSGAALWLVPTFVALLPVHWWLTRQPTGVLRRRADGSWTLPGSDERWRLVSARASSWLVVAWFRPWNSPYGPPRALFLFRDSMGERAHRRLRQRFHGPWSERS